MLQIVVGQRGWVFVGKVSREAEFVIIDEARVVRRWGTTRGLAQLANEGPQPNTALDDPCRVKLHILATVGFYDCNEEAWGAKVGKAAKRKQ